MSKPRISPRSLQFHISTLMVGMVVVVGTVVTAIAHFRTSAMVERAADRLVERNHQEAVAGLESLFRPGRVALEFLYLHPIMRAGSFEERMKSVPFLRTALDASSTVTSASIGYESGDFFLLRRVVGEAERAQLAAPAATAFVVQSRDRDRDGAWRGRYTYLDARLDAIATAERPEFVAFDPLSRPWYREAMAARGPIRTSPYVFFTTRAVGATVARPTQDGAGVVALDVEVADLSKMLGGLRTTTGTEVAMMEADGGLVAYPDESRLVQAGGEGGSRLAPIGEVGVPALAALAARLPSMGLARMDPGSVA